MVRPHSLPSDNDLQEFFAPAAEHRLSISEKEEIYRSLLSGMPTSSSSASYHGSFLWRTLAGVFSSWAPVAAVVVVLVLTGTGFTFAKSALPGDFLYPVKRINENITDSLRFSIASKASVEADHMHSRLDEVAALEAKGTLTDKTTEELDQDFRLQRREATKNIQVLENDGKQELAASLRARLNAAEDRYERLFKGKRRKLDRVDQEEMRGQKYPTVKEDKATHSPSAL